MARGSYTNFSIFPTPCLYMSVSLHPVGCLSLFKANFSSLESCSVNFTQSPAFSIASSSLAPSPQATLYTGLIFIWNNRYLTLLLLMLTILFLFYHHTSFFHYNRVFVFLTSIQNTSWKVTINFLLCIYWNDRGRVSLLPLHFPQSAILALCSPGLLSPFSLTVFWLRLFPPCANSLPWPRLQLYTTPGSSSTS